VQQCNAADISLPAPLVFVRCSPEPTAKCTEFLGGTPGSTWLYQATRLGDTGNHAQYLEACRRPGNEFAQSTPRQADGGITLRAPVGCMGDLDSVVSSTIWTVVGTTLMLILLICLKRR
jgi:hypothetical protein